jgi:hypothetical protein
VTIDEATKMIEKCLKGANEGRSVVMSIQALQLSVEALKRVKKYRDNGEAAGMLLQGETPEKVG